MLISFMLIKKECIVESRTFECEGERNDHMLHHEQVFGNVFERREVEY